MILWYYVAYIRTEELGFYEVEIKENYESD